MELPYACYEHAVSRTSVHNLVNGEFFIALMADMTFAID